MLTIDFKNLCRHENGEIRVQALIPYRLRGMLRCLRADAWHGEAALASTATDVAVRTFPFKYCHLDQPGVGLPITLRLGFSWAQWQTLEAIVATGVTRYGDACDLIESQLMTDSRNEELRQALAACKPRQTGRDSSPCCDGS